ncbi:MAG: dockerin type I repeat-containing protein [Ruminococcus sp.]|nr:dockerin type I repeat-containing protein [Ruminococcus sp.]
MKKLLAILLTMLMLLSTVAITANAAIPPQLYGDVDYDQDVNIMDATAVQQHLANINILRGTEEAADVDGDCKITIIDATTIQLYLANVITEFPAGKYYFLDKRLEDVVPSFLSGKALVGVPVDFEVYGYASPDPSKARLYVNNELVDTAIGEDSTLTYTFPQVGVYEVSVSLTDKWGYYAGVWTTEYEVVEPVADTTKPYISNIAITGTHYLEPTITVSAIYGSSDYTYSYYITEEYKYYNENNELITTSRIVYSKENIKENSITIEDYDIIEYFAFYDVKVVVTDSNGNTAEETTSFRCEPIPPA